MKFLLGLSLALLLLAGNPATAANLCEQVVGEEKVLPDKPVPTLDKGGENPALHGDYDGGLTGSPLCFGVRVVATGNVGGVPHIRIRYGYKNTAGGRVREYSETLPLESGGKFAVPMPSTTCRNQPMNFTFLADGSLDVQCTGYTTPTNPVILKKKA